MPELPNEVVFIIHAIGILVGAIVTALFVTGMKIGSSN